MIKNLFGLIFLFSVTNTVCAFSNNEEKMETTVLKKYAEVAVFEHSIVTKDEEFINDYDNNKAQVVCITTVDETKYCQVAFPHKKNDKKSYLVGFKQDFSTKFYEISWRGKGVNIDDEQKSFKEYDGKTLEM